MSKKKLSIKLNIPMRGFLVGQIAHVEVDKDGIALDPFWRNRIRDSKIDNCIEIVSAKKEKK